MGFPHLCLFYGRFEIIAGGVEIAGLSWNGYPNVVSILTKKMNFLGYPVGENGISLGLLR